MSDGIHESWARCEIEDVRAAAKRAGIDHRGDRAKVTTALTRALPATGYTALTGLSWRAPGSKVKPHRVAEIGDPVPDTMLAYSGGWLYADGKIEPNGKGQ